MSAEVAYYWDLSVYVAPAVFVAVAVPVLILAHRTRAKGNLLRRRLRQGYSALTSRELFMFDRPGSYTAAWVLTLASLAMLGAGLIAGHYPLEAEYHQWRSVSGEVERIESRFTASGNGGTDQAHVVVMDGAEYHLTDTRAALLSEGDRVSLMCKRAWQYGAASLLTCRWGGEVVNR